LEEILCAVAGVLEQKCQFKLNGDIKMYFVKQRRTETQLWIGNMLLRPVLMNGSETLVLKYQ
jgi:hypothetical protein